MKPAHADCRRAALGAAVETLGLHALELPW